MPDQQTYTLDQLQQQGWKPADAPPPAAPVSSARAEIRRPIASGRGTQFSPELPDKIVSAATTPLAHPTGVDAIDSFTSPVGLASLAAGGYGIARAGLAGGGMAAAKEALSQATPLVKYEAARSGLRALGVPDSVASVVGAALSGYKAKAPTLTAAEAEEAALVKAGVNPQTIAKMKASGRLGGSPPAPTSPVETAPGGTVPPSGPPPAAAPSAPAPSPTPASLLPEGSTVPPATAEYYPQKFLNEVAIQGRRQKVTLGDGDYAVAKGMIDQGATPQQAVETLARAKAGTVPAQTSTTAPVAAPSGKPFLTAEETPQYVALRSAGKSHQEAMDAIQAARTLRGSLPTTAQVKSRVEARNATGRWSKDDQ